MRPVGEVSYSTRGVQLVVRSVWMPHNPSLGYLMQVAKRWLPPITRPVKHPDFDARRFCNIVEVQISWEWSDV